MAREVTSLPDWLGIGGSLATPITGGDRARQLSTDLGDVLAGEGTPARLGQSLPEQSSRYIRQEAAEQSSRCVLALA